MAGGHQKGRIVKPFGIRGAKTILLILDVLSDFRFPQGKATLQAARRTFPRIAALKQRAAQQGIPAVYVNDNLGLWRSDLPSLRLLCTRPPALGADLVERIAPSESDLFLLKPRHSAFYATPLSDLVEQAGTERLIVTGLSSSQCILFTANDAYLRRIRLAIPRDCIGSAKFSETRFALQYFSSVLGADTAPSSRVKLP